MESQIADSLHDLPTSGLFGATGGRSSAFPGDPYGSYGKSPQAAACFIFDIFRSEGRPRTAPDGRTRLVACNSEIGSGIAKGWWWLAPVW
ncbi:MAG: hypothetical protein ACREQ1_15710, partial [Woeseiaceae bacterium]